MTRSCFTPGIMCKRDVQAATGISIPTITRAIVNGELVAEYEGGRYNILPADVLRYAQKMEQKRTARMYPLWWIENYLKQFHGYEE